MSKQCCSHCKKWNEESDMYKTTVKKYRRTETAFFCDKDHAIRWKRIHEYQPAKRRTVNNRPLYAARQ